MDPNENTMAEVASLKFHMQTADLEEGMFKGMASAYNVLVDGFVPTIFEKGAFAATIEKPERPILILWQHDTHEPIGTPVELNDTDKGLEIVGKVSDTQRGRDALTLMRDGVVTELSVGFDPVKFEYKENKEKQLIRHISEARLWEVSPVSFAANRKAKISEVQAAYNEAKEALHLQVNALKAQTVTFDKKKWTPAKASKWLKDHKFKSDKKDTTDTQHRYRQFAPSQCKTGSYKTLTENLPGGVSIVVCETGDSAEMTNYMQPLYSTTDGSNTEWQWVGDTTTYIPPEGNVTGTVRITLSEPTTFEDRVARIGELLDELKRSEEPIPEDCLETLQDIHDILGAILEAEEQHDTDNGDGEAIVAETLGKLAEAEVIAAELGLNI